MKILFLTNLLPYPLDNGGKIKTYTTLDSLKKMGHQIDLVCFTEQSKIDEKSQNNILKLCCKVKQIQHKLTTAENKKHMIFLAAESLLSKYSFGVFKYLSNDMKKCLDEWCKETKYDCVYFDHLQMCVYEKQLKELIPNAKFVLDEHNCEAVIMARNARTTSNLAKKAFLNIEYSKLRRFESEMLKKSNANIVLSKEDYIELKQQCGEDFKHAIIPIGVIDHGLKKERISDGKLNILFVGTLTWEPNNQGLVWFLSKVVPLLDKKQLEYRLYIVGKNPSPEVKKMAEQYENIIITGYVNSVDEYYDNCDCMIVPLFIGSGQRVKLIEAFSKGMPAVSTSIGAEGLNFLQNENILIANTEEAFVQELLRMKDENLRRKISGKARETYENNYSLDSIEKKLMTAIKELE